MRAMRVEIGGTSLELMKGDITEMDTEAIVNAANSRLKHGGGVAGAIVRKGGRIIQEESDRIGHCDVGSAVITGGGLLKAKYVIHAVGPRMGEGDEDRKLRGATRSALRLADKKGIRSIAFPAISTGIFGYPVDRAARNMVEETITYLKGGSGLQRVVFCLFDDQGYDAFERELRTRLGP